MEILVSSVGNHRYWHVEQGSNTQVSYPCSGERVYVREISVVPTKRGNARWITHLNFVSANYTVLPRGLRRRFAAARLMGLRVRIQPRSWMSVSCECCGLTGIGLCYGPIICPEDSYRVLCVVVELWKNKNISVTDTINKVIPDTTSIDWRPGMFAGCKVGHCKHGFETSN